MSIPNNQDIYAYVLPGGQIPLTVMFQTFLNSGIEQPVSGVQLVITPVGGGSAVVTDPTLTEIDQATYQYVWSPPQTTAPGDYVATWTSTSPAWTITQVVTVVPLPSQSPDPGLYASLAQYRQREYDQLTPDDLVNYHLQLASEVIDEALIGAVYPTDADGMPTNPEHIAIFMRACCAQVAFQIGNNDPQNIKPQYSAVGMAGVTQSRAASAQGGVLPRLATACGDDPAHRWRARDRAADQLVTAGRAG